MAENEEISKKVARVVPKNAELSPEKMLQKYGKMSVEKQRIEFYKIESFLNIRLNIEKASKKELTVYLMFLRFTKFEVITPHVPELDKGVGVREKIMDVVILFKHCLEKLNEIPNEKLNLFVAQISRGEISVMRYFTVAMIDAVLEYPHKYSDPAAMTSAYLIYAQNYFGRLLRLKAWISKVIEDSKSGTRKSKEKAVEDKRNAFEKSKDDYKRLGNIFLVLAFATAGLLLLWGLLLGFNTLCLLILCSNNSYFVASSVAGKIIVSATLFFLLGVFSKLSFAYKHNETICRQRHDVLSSYEDIYHTVQERAFVLQKAVEAVFDHQPTGLSKLQSDKGDSSVTLSDIANLMSKNSDKV